MAESFISVGKLGKPHGLSGAFRFLLDRELKSKLKLPKHFMIEHKGSYIPWFIKKVEWLGFHDGLIEFEEISSKEEAKSYSTKNLFLSNVDYNLLFKKDAESYSYLVGYSVKDKKIGEIGLMTEVHESSHQILCLVKKGNKEFYIPLADDLVQKIDKRKKEIIFNLPDGLLDL